MFLKNQSNEQDNSDQALEAEAPSNQTYENVSAIDLGLNSQMDYPILNFFGGSVRTDRVEHENTSRRSGIAHWKANGRGAQSYVDQVEHAGFAPAQGSINQVQRSTAGYGTSAQSPGMGLEGENLQSFITGSHHKVIPIAQPIKTEPMLQSEPATTVSEAAQQGHTELPSGAPAPAMVFKFRRMKTTTFHSLLAMAMNE
ncbi:MAG: hypothetical protein WC028_20925 [Candidatus Obscuribacterales bacterium]